MTTPTPLQIDYIDPDGYDWDLSDLSMANGYICSAIAGIEGLPVSTQTVPLLDGTAFTNFYIPQPGNISIAILVAMPANSQNEMDYYNLLDRLIRAFLTRRNELPKPGYLQIQRPDGSVRQVATFTTSGLDTPFVGIDDKSLYSFTLQTPDPYWQDAEPQSLNFSLNVAAGILPLLPVQLAAGTVLGNVSVTNNGTAPSYPTWTITGPGTPTFANLTTGMQWGLNAPVPAGNVVQVVTKPGAQSAVNLTTATSVWDSLVYSSLRQLWAFTPGVNNLSLAMLGATPVTQVGLQWTNRWSRA